MHKTGQPVGHYSRKLKRSPNTRDQGYKRCNHNDQPPGKTPDGAPGKQNYDNDIQVVQSLKANDNNKTVN